MRTTVEVVPAPQDITVQRMQSVHMDNVVPVNWVPGSPSEISRSSELCRFHVNGQAFKTEKHVRTGISLTFSSDKIYHNFSQ